MSRNKTYHKKLQLILDAAKTRFSENGFQKTTLEEISRGARVGKATIYYYFSSKEEIFLSVVKREGDHLLGAMKEAVASKKPAPKKLAELFRAKTKAMLSIWKQLNLTLKVIEEVLPLARRLYGEYVAQEEALLRRVVEEGIKSKVFASSLDAATTAHIIQIAQAGIYHIFADEQSVSDLMNRTDRFVQLILKGLQAR